MRKNKRLHRSQANLRVLVVFLIIVSVAIVLSLLYRLFTLIQESRFKGTQVFTVGFISEREYDIVAIHPKEKTLTHLKVRGLKDTTAKQRAVGIIVNATVNLPAPFEHPSKVDDYFRKALLRQSKVKTNLTVYDLVRLLFVVQRISPHAIESEDVSLPLPQTELDEVIQRLFINQTLTDENKTITIINATGVAGRGSQLERALVNLGANVIAVKSVEQEEETSSIQYFGEKSYTVSYLSSLLSMPLQKDTQQGLSDIIIVIGKDQIKKRLY